MPEQVPQSVSGTIAPPELPSIPGYEILGILGQGGMGHVYKARHVKLGRLAAIKVIRPERVPDRSAVDRFLREARAAAQLVHANVVVVFDADEVLGLHYLAMEYVEGKTLAQLVQESGPLPIAPACEYIRQAALGLQH